MNKDAKKKRRQILKEIIDRVGAGDQQHLLMELKERGIEATQATVSRDLRDMGFVKVPHKAGVYKYERIDKKSEGLIWDRLKVLFQNFVVDIKSTNNLLLIKTSPGNANGVASLIDSLQRGEILGTVAGDDTILIIVDTNENRETLERVLRQLL